MLSILFVIIMMQNRGKCFFQYTCSIIYIPWFSFGTEDQPYIENMSADSCPGEWLTKVKTGTVPSFNCKQNIF